MRSDVFVVNHNQYNAKFINRDEIFFDRYRCFCGSFLYSHSRTQKKKLKLLIEGRKKNKNRVRNWLHQPSESFAFGKTKNRVKNTNRIR